MILKLTNKDENFYQYMGRFFGSRTVQRQTNDRIFDDNNKIWYLYIENDVVTAFTSVTRNVIKNIYSTKEEHLVEILKEIKHENKNEIAKSIVTTAYLEIYEKCKFEIEPRQFSKNFVTIYMKKGDQK